MRTFFVAVFGMVLNFYSSPEGMSQLMFSVSCKFNTEVEYKKDSGF